MIQKNKLKNKNKIKMNNNRNKNQYLLIQVKKKLYKRNHKKKVVVNQNVEQIRFIKVYY